MPKYIDADKLKEALRSAIERNHEAHFALIDSDFEDLIDDADEIEIIGDKQEDGE